MSMVKDMLSKESQDIVMETASRFGSLFREYVMEVYAFESDDVQNDLSTVSKQYEQMRDKEDIIMELLPQSYDKALLAARYLVDLLIYQNGYASGAPGGLSDIAEEDLRFLVKDKEMDFNDMALSILGTMIMQKEWFAILVEQLAPLAYIGEQVLDSGIQPGIFGGLDNN